MSVKRLDALFNPRSIAVVGASEKPDSLGTFVMRNLLAGEFGGPIMPVNPAYESVLGVLCYESVDKLPKVPSLAVVCTPHWTVSNILVRLGEMGTSAVILMTELGEDPNSPASKTFRQEVLNAARLTGMRVLGPSSMGFQVPGLGLNASWLRANASVGKLALVSQSGSVCAGVLEWANSHGIGFSHIVSTGSSADIDIGDLLDYLAMQMNTKAVLLYLRSVQDSRKFLSAARALARIKPIITIRAGRFTQFDGTSNVSAEFHDNVFDAAIRRAGLLRVNETDELFDAAETLTYAQNLRGERLAIVCNGQGPGEMAADALLAGGGTLSPVSEETRTGLNMLRGRRLCNPLDIGRDADAARYRKTLAALLKDPDIDAVLVMHAPTSVDSAELVAREVASAARKTTRNVLACWLGESERPSVREIFADAGIPVYVSPDKAARAFLHLVNYRRNQEMLLQTPSTPPPSQIAGREIAHTVIRDALSFDQTCLDEVQSALVLSAYGIITAESAMAHTVDDAVHAAGQLGFPVSLRLSSPDIERRFSVGNISFDLGSSDAVRTAAESFIQRFHTRYPDEPLTGLVLQRMVRRNDPLVLMAGIADDPAFGRVIQFGAGGISRNLRGGPCIALPPLNMSLAEELIARSGVGEMIDHAASGGISKTGLCWLLVQLSELALDCPEIRQLEINPLLIDAQGILALDSRLAIANWEDNKRHFAIRPYPSELEVGVSLRDGRQVMLRPIRPEDEPAYKDLLTRVGIEDLRLRFHGVSKMPRSLLAQLIHIDYDREMAFVAHQTDAAGRSEILGVIDISPARGTNEAEFGVIVRSDLKGSGLGQLLLERITRYCRERGFDTLYGLVLPENESMLKLARRLGFRSTPLLDEDMIKVYLQLKVGSTT